MRKQSGLLAVGLFALGCGNAPDSQEENVRTTGEQTLSFHDFRATLPVDDSGYYIVEWDLLLDEHQLYDYWLALPSSHQDSLIINKLSNGSTPVQALTMTYCFDNSFTSAEKTTVQSTIATAVSDWSAAAGKTFSVTRDTTEDGTGCTNSNSDVSFNVRKVTGTTSSSFFPLDSRSKRELKLAGAHMASSDFKGIMRHEFGHVYGFRHEQIRQCPSSGDNGPYNVLTRVDRPSVMHYNNVCGDTSSTFGSLSTYDKRGARCAYSGECEWVKVSGTARDVGVSADGAHVWVIGNATVGGGYSIHRRNGSSWQTVPGGGVAIAVEPGGNAWIVNDQQNIFRYNGTSFEQVSGAGRDVAVGANGKVWLIGNGVTSGGYTIHRRDGSSWTQVAGGAVRISVDPSGNAWVVNDQQSIFRWNGSSFVQQTGAANDISIGGDGSIWVVGTGLEPGGNSIHELVSNEWFKTTGSALRISVGNGTPWVVNDERSIFYNRWE